MVVSIISCRAVWKELLSSVILLEGDQQCWMPRLTSCWQEEEEANGRSPRQVLSPLGCAAGDSSCRALFGVGEEENWGVEG